MSMTNQQIIEKATMTMADLASGGKMNEQQSDRFLRMVQSAPTIMNSARFITMTGDSRKIEKIGFGGRILRAAQEGVALTEDKKAKPGTGTIHLQCKEVIAQIDLTYDTIENNIEQENFHDSLVQMIAERASLDLEELVLNGDMDNATDDYLALINGILKKANQHVVDAKSLEIAKTIFRDAIKAAPAKYQRNRKDWRFYLSNSSEINWQDKIADRQTNLGDATLQGGQATAYGVPIQGCAMMLPKNDGAGTMVADGIYTHPQNIVVGMSRNLSFEFDKDITARKFIIVLTAKVDAQLEEADAVAKIINIKE